MPLLDDDDARYLRTLHALWERGRLEINFDCPECGDRMPDRPRSDLSFSDQHTILILHAHDEGATHEHDVFSVVIGCEGYHIMDFMTGKVKDLAI